MRARMRGSLRYGLANVSRRAGTSIAQISALGLGLMALLLLTFVRTDLLDRWQRQLSADAPNRFIINVQDDQVGSVREFIVARGIAEPVLFPMVRARLVATLNDEGSLKLEAQVRNGRGYVAADKNFDESMGIGWIPIDSVHSPVRKVNYKVESARVGRSSMRPTRVFSSTASQRTVVGRVFDSIAA